jgi:hypothetical protein
VVKRKHAGVSRGPPPALITKSEKAFPPQFPAFSPAIDNGNRKVMPESYARRLCQKIMPEDYAKRLCQKIMEDKFNELVNQLRAALGDNLVALVAYGSAIAAPGNVKKSDYQTMIVAVRLGAADLNKARPAVKSWTAAGFPLPVFFTKQEFTDSLDVFAVEFRQLKRAYRVLYGEDLIAAREASPANLRLQIEYELRGKLLRLRTLFLPEGGSVERLIPLMTDSIVSFVRYLRPALELVGETPPLGRLATVQRVGARLQVDVTPLERILRLRDEPVQLLEVEAQDLFASYVDCLSKLIAAIDKL